MSRDHSAGQGKDSKRFLRAKAYNRSKNHRPPNEKPRDMRGTTLRLLELLPVQVLLPELLELLLLVLLLVRQLLLRPLQRLLHMLFHLL